MVQTNRVGQNYSENIIDPYLAFESEQTWSVSSGTGTASATTDYSFQGNRSLTIQNTAPTIDLIATNSVQNTVIGFKLAECQLSFYIRKNNVSDSYSGNVKIFKNAVLLDTQTWVLEDTQDDAWYRFVSDQNYSLATGDIITFTFQFDGDAGFVGAKTIYIGGLMLAQTERLDYAPAMYNKPIPTSTPELPTSNGQYILNVNSGVYTWSDFNNYTGWASYIDDTYTSGSPFAVSATTDTILPNKAVTIVDSQKPIDINEFYYAGGLVLTAVTGTFEVDETITGGTSGATATLRSIDGGDYYFVNLVGAFQTSETITGGTSGATATVSSLLDPKITGRNGDSLDAQIYFKILPSSTNAEIDVWVDIGGLTGELYRQRFYFRTATESYVNYALPSAYTLDTFEANGGKVYVRCNQNCDVYDMNFNFDRTHKAI